MNWPPQINPQVAPQMPPGNEPERFGNDSDSLQVRIATRVPAVAPLLARIDSRALFSRGLAQVLRLGATMGMALCVLIWARNLEWLTTVDESIKSFTVFVNQVLGLVAVFYLWAIVTSRAHQLATARLTNVIGIFLKLVALVIELAAIGGFWSLTIFGVSKLLAGPEGEAAWGLALLVLPMKHGWQPLFGNSEPGVDPSALEVTSRLFGVGAIAGAIVFGFLTLLTGYFVKDVLRLIYEFLRRSGKGETRGYLEAIEEVEAEDAS
jgi:hypothetical protein